LSGRAVCTLGPSEVRALSRHTALFNFSLCSSDPRSEVNALSEETPQARVPAMVPS
jgi:hypothetical protein